MSRRAQLRAWQELLHAHARAHAHAPAAHGHHRCRNRAYPRPDTRSLHGRARPAPALRNACNAQRPRRRYNSNLDLSDLRTFVATPNGTCVAKHACNVRRPFPDADSNTQPLGLGFDESQVSPAKNEIDIDEDQPLGERMRKKAKLLEDEAKQLEAKAKQLENKAVDATEASVDDAPCK